MKKQNKKFFNLLAVFLVGFVGAVIGTLIVSAHGGDTSKIHACVKTTILNGAPNVRIVGPNDTCNNNETAVDWDREAGGGLPQIVCIYCYPRDLLFRLNQQNFLNAALDAASLSNSTLVNQDFTGASFIHALLGEVYAKGSNFSNTNFSYANFTPGAYLKDTNFSNSNLTSAELSGTNLENANFTGANLSEVLFFNPISGSTAYIKNTNFTGTNLTGATGMDVSYRDGVIWSNTTCPDGTNSDDNGNTCEGHLVP